MKKDVIYIDVEDDITAIIDKIKAGESSIVALVPPKRSTVLQSAVNMKLLKRSTGDLKKQLVLITNDTSLLALAGGIGLYAAKNLQSKPEIPAAPAEPSSEPEVIEGEDVALDQAAPIGALDDSHKGKKPEPSPKAATAPKDKGDKAKDKAAAKKDKKNAVPSFNKFRKKLLIGLGVFVGLLVLWFVMFRVLPTATITVQAQTTKVPTNLQFTADSKVGNSDIDKGVLKAEHEEIQRTITEGFNASGEQNVGQKSSGKITVQNCANDDPITIPAGTTFTSNSGLTFTNGAAVQVPGADFDDGACQDPGEADVTVAATQPGDQYNLGSGTGYGVSGQGNKVTGIGGQMSGGTNEVVKVVTQADVDGAKNKVLTADHTDVLNELKEEFGEDYIVLNESFVVTTGNVSSSPAVGDRADTGQLNAQFTFSVLGVKKDELNQFLEKYQKTQIDNNKQSVYNTGIDQAGYKLLDKPSNEIMKFDINTSGYVGPTLDTNQLAEEVSGKRYSEVIEIVKSRPGVNDVKVDLSPFWVSKAPKASRINIVLDVSEHANQ